MATLLTRKNNIKDNNKLLLPELPFYGVGGTIYRVEEAEESYYKVLYNSDGSINKTKIPVPKNKKRNFKLVLNDYCKDLKNYLEEFQNQYLEYENTNYKPKLSNKNFYLLAGITAISTIASIPILLTTAWTGLVFSSISAFSLYIVCDIKNKDITKEKTKKNFMKQYKSYQRDLANYRSSNPIYQEKYEPTLYTSIGKSDRSYLKIFPKIKLLRKEPTKEAA